MHWNGGHLGHVTIVISVEFSFYVPESLPTKSDSKWPSSFSEKPVLIFICK